MRHRHLLLLPLWIAVGAAGWWALGDRTKGDRSMGDTATAPDTESAPALERLPKKPFAMMAPSPDDFPEDDSTAEPADELTDELFAEAAAEAMASVADDIAPGAGWSEGGDLGNVFGDTIGAAPAAPSSSQFGLGGFGTSGVGVGGGGTGTGTFGGLSPRGNAGGLIKKHHATPPKFSKPPVASAPRDAAPEPTAPAATAPPTAATAMPMMAPPAPEPASPSEISPSAIDDALDALPIGSIAFNTPEEIPLGESEVIELLLSMRESESALANSVAGAGPVETARIRISNQMQAELSGLGFDIEPITPETQAVSRSAPTRWRWQIRPTEPDAQPLHLTLSVQVRIDGERAARTIETFEREIHVRVPIARRVKDFLAGHTEMLFTLLLAPLAAAGWRRWRVKKASHQQPVDPPAVDRAA